MSSVEDIFFNRILTSQIVIPIIGDVGVYLFYSILYNLFNIQKRFQEIRSTIVSIVSDNWNNFTTKYYNLNGDNFFIAED